MADFTTIPLVVDPITDFAERGTTVTSDGLAQAAFHDRIGFADRFQVVWRDAVARPQDSLLENREIGARLLDEYDRVPSLRLYVLAVGILFNAPYPLAGSEASYAAPSSGLTAANAGQIHLGGWLRNATVIAQFRRVEVPTSGPTRGLGLTPLSRWSDCSMKIESAGSTTWESASITFPADTWSGDLLEMRVLAQQIDIGDPVVDGYFGELAVWMPRLTAVKAP